MRIIIGGPARSAEVASALRQEGRDIVLIDNDLDAINESQSIDCLIISGSVLSRRALVKAGITDAEVDHVHGLRRALNLFSCAFAKRIFSEENKSSSRKIRTIARISTEHCWTPKIGAGPLPVRVQGRPHRLFGEEIVSRLASGLVVPAFEEAIPIHEGAYIPVAEAEEGNPLVGSTVKEVRETFSSLPPIIAIQTNGQPAKLRSIHIRSRKRQNRLRNHRSRSVQNRSLQRSGFPGADTRGAQGPGVRGHRIRVGGRITLLLHGSGGSGH